MGCGFEFSWGKGDSYDLYHPLKKVPVPNCQIKLLQNQKWKEESRKWKKGGGAPSGGCCGAEHPKMVASVVCPLKTDAGVYWNAMHSCYLVCVLVIYYIYNLMVFYVRINYKCCLLYTNAAISYGFKPNF